MHGFDVDLTTTAQLGDDLIPRLGALRDEDPLYWSETNRCWIVTANGLVTEGFSGKLPLSAKRHLMLAGLFADAAEREAVIGYVMEVFPDFVLSTDPPEQSRLRKLLMTAFSKVVAESYRPKVRELVAEVMNALEGREEIDFVAEVARPITARAILHVMGLSTEHLPNMERWAQSLTEGLSGNPDRGLLAGANGAMLEMRDVFLAEIETLGGARGSDFLSELLIASDGSDKLTRNEIVAQMILVLVAGHDTTLNTVSLSIAKLADLPDERAFIRTHPEKFDACIMELMRVVAMSTAQARIVTEDFSWVGRSIKAGQIVFLMIAAANHDPARFADADRINFERSQAANMTFAPGRHFCIGHWFAKMMMSEIFPAFLDRYESWDLLDERIAFNASPIFRGALRLPIRLHSRQL